MCVSAVRVSVACVCYVRSLCALVVYVCLGCECMLCASGVRASVVCLLCARVCVLLRVPCDCACCL